MTKEEKIRESYGDYWDKINQQVKDCALKNNGWINSILEHPPTDVELEFGDYTFRPLSLQGIEDNNGWIKIESEDDLPKKTIEYHVLKNGSLSKALYAGKNRWFTKDNNFPKTTEIQGITHYQEIIIPQPPIY